MANKDKNKQNKQDRAVKLEGDSKPSKKASESKKETNSIALNGDFFLYPKEPLPYLDKGPVKAYRARMGGQHGANLFVLICDKSLTPRFLSIPKYSSITSNNLCKLVTTGKVFWPPMQGECFCFVYDDTIGMPLLHNREDHLAFAWKPETVLTNIILPAIDMLTKLRNKELAHGELWLGNMFDGGADAAQKIFFGECLATPASSQLPMIYEPVERALADPIGRGAGDSIDDLYSFGISLAIMLREEDPMRGFSDRKIIEHKLDKGSYLSMLGKDRLSGAVLELLRGLLYDDPEQRWTVEDLEAWVDGRRLSPKQAPKRAKSMRPMIFKGQKYHRPEVLAMDLHLDTHETMKIVESNELGQWVERAIEEKLTKSRLEQALASLASFERGANHNDRVAVVISHALYPEAAVRYRGILFNPAGFGKYLTQSYILQKDMQAFVDVIKFSFVIPIVRQARLLDKGTLMAAFDLCRSYIKQTALNGGIERCLYIMDTEAPCLSPILENYYVQSSKDMLMAFENICEKSKPDILFDRHIISYMSVKDRQNIDPYVTDLSAKNRHVRILAQLKVIATMQKRCELKGLPNLAKWLAGELKPVYDRLHDKNRRDDVSKKIEGLLKDGNIKSIAVILNNEALYLNDLDQFKKGILQYEGLIKEQELINKNLKKGRLYGQNTGRQIASVLSMILSMAIMIFSVYQVFSGG